MLCFGYACTEVWINCHGFIRVNKAFDRKRSYAMFTLSGSKSGQFELDQNIYHSHAIEILKYSVLSMIIVEKWKLLLFRGERRGPVCWSLNAHVYSVQD